jgi:hypothetical protein
MLGLAAERGQLNASQSDLPQGSVIAAIDSGSLSPKEKTYKPLVLIVFAFCRITDISYEDGINKHTKRLLLGVKSYLGYLDHSSDELCSKVQKTD